MQQNKKLSIIVIACSLVLVILLSFFSFYISQKGQKALYITEICGSNADVPNQDGFYLDYVEITNRSDRSVDVSLYHLTDDENLDGFVFPKGTKIEAGESVVIWCGREKPEYSSLFYAPFAISQEGGETILLTNANRRTIDGCVTIEFTKYPVIIRGEGDEWVQTDVCSPGILRDSFAEGSCSNHRSDLSPVCLSEVMASNISYPDAYGHYTDLVEIHNTGSEIIDISGYSMSDDASKIGFVFPEDTLIEPYGYAVVWLGDEGETGFYGNFSLSKSGNEILVLKNETGDVIDYIQTLPMEEDQVMILAGDRWVLSPYATPGYPNTEDGFSMWLHSMGYSENALIISEFMPANKTVLPDPEGEFRDWIEITNTSDEEMDLTGWFLSDNEENTTKYALPDLILGPGEFLLLYCGDGGEKEGVYYTGFNLSSKGEMIVLTGPGGIQGDKVIFGEAKTDRSYQRDQSTGEFIETIYATPGLPNTAEGYESFSALMDPKGELAIWEVMTTNDWYLPDQGNCYDLVEVRNVSDHAIDLSGFSLTDSASVPDKFVLPEMTLESGEYLVLLMSGDTSLTGEFIHGSFSLSGEEESLYLFKDTELVDYVLLFDIPNKCSYGRSEEGHGFFFMTSTPGTANDEGRRRIAEEPSYSLEAGCYETEDPLILELSGDGGKVYYTLDGSVPTEESSLYTEPIEITSTCVVRAVQIQDGCMPSDILTLNYLVNEGDTIPVLCVVTDPANLWGADGIYRPSWAVKEIEVAGNLSYFGDDGTFSQDCGISMHGMTTLLVNDKKSFTVRFRNNYDGPLQYPFFPDQDYDTYYSLLLRADTEGTFPTMMRDTMWGEICNRYSDHVMGLDHKYCAIYLNGEFWGIYTVREHFSPEYYAARRGVPVDDCRMLKSYYRVGDALYAFNEWTQDHPLYIEENWEYACSVVDIESFADWMIFQAYTGNKDVNGNMRYFYCEADGLWRCAISDVDLGMFSGETFKVPLYAVQHGSICRALMQNKEFQQLLIEKLSYFLNGPLSDDNMLALIDELHEEIVDEIPKEADRWGYADHTWERLVGDLREYVSGRAVRMVYGLQEYLYMPKEQLEEYFGDILATQYK